MDTHTHECQTIWLEIASIPKVPRLGIDIGHHTLKATGRVTRSAGRFIQVIRW